MGVNVFDCATQQFSSFLHDKNSPETLISNEIKDILIYINENYDNVITREILADRMGYSPNYFSTLFKENVGMGCAFSAKGCALLNYS